MGLCNYLINSYWSDTYAYCWDTNLQYRRFIKAYVFIG